MPQYDHAYNSLPFKHKGGTTGTWTQSPVIFSFQSHHGPVYDVQCSPYHRNLFLSCGTDSACYLHSLLEVSDTIYITVLMMCVLTIVTASVITDSILWLFILCQLVAQ